MNETIELILCGVGGQGILSVAQVLTLTAAEHGLACKQSEVHGMSQRGGTVQAHVRLARGIIHSPLIPAGRAELVVGLEPLETLRHLHFLKPGGTVVSSTVTVENLAEYPERDLVLAELERWPRHSLLDAEALAREAGNPRTQSTVLVGAVSPFLPFDVPLYLDVLERMFGSKGQALVEANRAAFALGRQHSLEVLSELR
ncbi:MAG: hypothetical protein A2284_08210 [Deltaproteobacteria bacterium RIFOXYA12_FULL_61_11]|nr:MAG: hypothetical protein A2284_08210 [Deltaproteobacteria bacterium RIFOXYA12_FULL_61_11]